MQEMGKRAAPIDGGGAGGGAARAGAAAAAEAAPPEDAATQGRRGATVGASDSIKEGQDASPEPHRAARGRKRKVRASRSGRVHWWPQPLFSGPAVCLSTSMWRQRVPCVRPPTTGRSCCRRL
jgi:hypothetical protein